MPGEQAAFSSHVAFFVIQFFRSHSLGMSTLLSVIPFPRVSRYSLSSQ